MSMTPTSWTVRCDAHDCSSPWSARSKPLAVKGDQAEAISAAEKAGWRRCWSRDPKTGERKIMRPRNPGWWCPWHVARVLTAEADGDRRMAELQAVLDAARAS